MQLGKIDIIKTFSKEAVYLNGQKIYEKDYLDAVEVLIKLGVEFNVKYYDPEIKLTEKLEDLDLNKHERGFEK